MTILRIFSKHLYFWFLALAAEVYPNSQTQKLQMVLSLMLQSMNIKLMIQEILMAEVHRWLPITFMIIILLLKMEK